MSMTPEERKAYTEKADKERRELEENLRGRYLAKNMHPDTAHDVFEMAWDYGHSNGPEEVGYYYADFAVLVNDATLRGRVNSTT